MFADMYAPAIVVVEDGFDGLMFYAVEEWYGMLSKLLSDLLRFANAISKHMQCKERFYGTSQYFFAA